MAKARRYYYECVYPCDVGFINPDQRRERWVRQGRSEIAQPTMHSVRCFPSKGISARGEKLPADYIVTNQPIGKNYTEEVAKDVSRPNPDLLGHQLRVMRGKVSKIKFQLVEPEDVTQHMKEHAWDYGDPQFAVDAKGKRVQVSGWCESLFITADQDVLLPKEVELNAKIGRDLLKAGKGA